MTVLARVVNYIHLNPVRARIVPAEKVTEFRWSSLTRFIKGPRFPQLTAKDWLRSLGFGDSKAGWKGYLEELIELSGDKKEQTLQGFATLSQGWAMEPWVSERLWRTIRRIASFHRELRPHKNEN